MITVHLIAGARPNFVKIAPLYHALKRAPWARCLLVHTGQHYSPEMSDAFFADLSLPAPDHHLGVGSAGHAPQIAATMQNYDALCAAEAPDWTIVVGDVNSTLACSLVAVKRGIPCAHLEAGLRSRDRTMPEEINRLLTDQACDLLWAPSADAVDNLLSENVPAERIELVGNIMIDTLELLAPKVAAAGLPAGLDLRDFVLATFHRPSNVDAPAQLARIVDHMASLAEVRPVVWPLHPRTRARLEDARLLAGLERNPRVHILPPQGYIAFMALVRAAGLLVTDSGGVQEETSYLGIPCLTVRRNTERPITVELGTNRLIDPEQITELGTAALARGERVRPTIPYWDGHTAGRIVESLRKAAMPAAPAVPAAEVAKAG